MTLNSGDRPFEISTQLAAWLAAIWVLCWINVFWPFLRFSLTALNYAAFSIVQIIPWFLLPFLFQRRRWPLFGLTILFAVLSAPFGLISAACSLATLPGDRTVKRVAEYPTPRGSVVVYYVNSGAVGYWGYRVWQQCSVMPGILAVHHLLSSPDHGYEAEVQPLDSRRVRIKMDYWHGSVSRPIEKVANLWILPCLWSRAG